MQYIKLFLNVLWTIELQMAEENLGKENIHKFTREILSFTVRIVTWMNSRKGSL